MSRNILIEISVLNPSTQLITTLHMSASNASAEGVYLDGKTWVPAIINDPEQSFGFWGEGRAQSLSVSYGQINFIVSKQLGNKAWTKLDFDGGDATVWDGEMGADFSTYKQIYTGKIGPLVSDSSREAHFSLLGMEAQLDRELLDRTYSGTGGDEGPSSMLGILKPISFGDCQNVAPVKLDPIRFIYAVDGYKAVTVNTIYSSTLPFTPPVATVANYAALAALTLKPGEWARCPSYFRLGGDPTNAKITADIGTPATTSDVARALVVKAGILPARIGASFATGTRGYSLYLTEQTNIGDAVRDAAFAESRLLLTDSRGVLHLAPMAAAKAAVTLADDGSSRPFVRSDTIIGEAPASPSWKVRIGHTPVWTVNSGAGEISEAVAKQAEDATATRKAADDARAEADKANADLVIVTKRLDDTVKDGILDRAEKRQWITAFEIATAERDKNVDQGTDQGATAQVAAYIAAYDALSAYLDGLVPAFADTSQDTPIDGPVFRARFVGYGEAESALRNAIEAKAAETAYWEKVTGPAKPADYADVTGDNTSKDTANVGGVPAATVNKGITDARKVADDARTDIDTINAQALPIIREAQRLSDEAIGAARDDIDQIKLDYDEVVENVQSITATGGPIDNVRAEASRIDKAYIAGDKALGERVDIVSASSTSGGGNLLSNTDFATLTGWNVVGNPAGATLSRNAAGETWMAGGENNLSFFQDGRSANDSDYIEAVSEPFTVTPSSWIQFYVFGASHRSNNWVSLFYYRVDGSYAGYAGENMAPRWDNGGRDPNGWDQIGKKSDKVPADAVTARMVLRKYNTFAGQGNSYAWFWRPYVSIAREGQTSWNPYASGNSKAVEVATNASIKTTSDALATSDKSFAEFKRDINATLDTPGTGVKAKLSVVETAITDKRFAASSRVDALETTINTPSTGLSAKVASHESAIVSLPDNYATAKRASDLEAVVITGPTRNSVLSGRIKTVEDVTTDGTFAAASRADALEASINGPTGALANITKLQTVTTNGSFAAASTVSTLRSEYDKTASTVSTQAGVISGLEDKNKAYWQVVADAGGERVSVTVATDGGSGGVDIVGNVRIAGGLVVEGTITSGKMAPSSVQQIAFQTLGYDLYVPRGGSVPGNPNPDPQPYDPDYPIP